MTGRLSGEGTDAAFFGSAHHPRSMSMLTRPHSRIPSSAFEAEIGAAVREGLAGTLCIHPSRPEAGAAALTPSPGRIGWDQSMCKLFVDNPGSGTRVLDGAMTDRTPMRLAEGGLEAAADASPQDIFQRMERIRMDRGNARLHTTAEVISSDQA